MPKKNQHVTVPSKLLFLSYRTTFLNGRNQQLRQKCKKIIRQIQETQIAIKVNTDRPIQVTFQED